MPNAKSDSVYDLQASLGAPTANRFQLENGLTVVHQPDFSAKLASVQVWVKTGSIHEGQWLGAGLSHFLEHMLFKGTARRGPLDISREVHAAGAYINAYTTYDRTVYHIDTPQESLAEAADILADMCFHATLADVGFATERDVILREIAMGEDDPDRQLFHAFARTCFRVHPYQHPVIGWRELFEKVTAEGLRSYYHTRYVPNNATLILVGALSLQEAHDLAEKNFGGIPRDFCTAPLVQREPAQLATRVERVLGDFQIERGILGYRIPGLGHEDLPALEALAHVLGHGQSSRLWQAIREEQRLVHHIDASCWTPGVEGLLWVSYVCDKGKRAQVELAIENILKATKSDVFDGSLVSKAVRQAVVSEVNSRKSMSGQAARLGAAEVVLGDLDYPRRHLDLLAATEPAALNRVAECYLLPERRTSVSLEAKAQTANFSAGEAKKTTDSGFIDQRMENGARLLLQPGGLLPKAHLRFVCLGGPAHEPENKRGVTGVLATLLVRDTVKRTARQVAEAVESVGGSFHEFAGNNSFGFSLEVLPNDVPLAIDLLEQALLYPKFVEHTFAVERDGQIAAIREEDDEVLDYARRRLRKHFFGKYPFASDYLGEIEDLVTLGLKDVETAKDKQLVGPNSVLAVSGQFDEAAVTEQCASILSRLPQGEEFLTQLFTPPQAGELFERLEREQAVVLRAYPDVGVKHEDHLLSEVLDELFSGMASVLFNRVREERGLAYYVASTRVIGLNCGMFTFYAGTQPNSAGDVREEILNEIARVCSGEFEKDELAHCLRRLSVRKRQSLQSPGSRAMQAALNALYGYPVNAWQDYDAKLAEVTPERLVAHAQKLFKPTHAIGYIVGPEGTNN